MRLIWKTGWLEETAGKGRAFVGLQWEKAGLARKKPGWEGALSAWLGKVTLPVPRVSLVRGEGWPGGETEPHELNRSSPGVRLAWKEETSRVGEGGQERVGLPFGGTEARRGREEGAPRGAGPGREWRRYRLRMASSRSHTHRLTFTGARARALSIGRPARGGEKLLGSVNYRAVGEGAGDTGLPSPADRRAAVTCVRESWAAAAMVFPSCTGGEGRTGRRGLGAGRRRRERPEARPGRAGGRLP